MSDEDYGAFPFNEAISFFRQKVNVPSPKWTDILEGAHSRAFTVAAATKEGMLVDFRAAVDKAISQGTTLEAFRKDFDNIVTKYGWDYKGTRGWRSRVIYETNMRTSYAAGRWQQMTDPDVVKLHPYWRYEHCDGEKHPRLEHLAWNGITLPVGDPWIATHACPNGWGCQCRWCTVTRRELAASGKSGPDKAPPQDMRKVTLNTSAGPVTLDVPRGVDPGWGYSIGETAFGRQLPETTMQAWREQGQKAFTRLTPGDWRSEGLKVRLPVDDPIAKLGATAATIEQLKAEIERAIGAEQTVLETPDNEPILIDATALSQHMPLDRSAFVPLLPEVISNPAEIWLSFEKHKGTGQVVLRRRIIKLIRDPRGRGRGMLFVAQASRGVMEAWTLIPMDRLGYLDEQRVGRLMWARDAT